MKIFEGLRPGDLRGMVRASVSVDEYESKVDDNAVVIAFAVGDREAANDVNRFIQKSYVSLLDTEVSAAPDQKGFYLVFVEMTNDDKLPTNVKAICGDLSALAEIEHWSVAMRGQDAVDALAVNEIEAVVEAGMNQSLDEFFNLSLLDHVVVNEGLWTVSSGSHQLSFRVEDFGDIAQVVERNNLYKKPLDESVQASAYCDLFSSMLGLGWSVEKLGESFVIYHHQLPQALLISSSPATVTNE